MGDILKKLEEIKGIGPKTLKLLNKLDIYTKEDLLTYYPFRYDVIKRSNIYELEQDDKIVIDGMIENVPNIFFFNRRMDRMNFRINIGTHNLGVVIFNRGFLKNKLLPGVTVTLIGKFDKKNNTVVASDLRFGLISSEEKIEGVYRSTYGLSGKQIQKFIEEALKTDFQVQDLIPTVYKEKYKFIEKEEAIKIVHNPVDLNAVDKARLRLKYEELFLFMLQMNYLKLNRGKRKGIKREVPYSLVEEFISKLPFELTVDQLKSVEDIYSDLISENRMNRLLQGDVGSGKTIVSVIAMYINYLSGYMSALMVPTEVLANQHYNNVVNILKEYDIRVEILTGKLRVSEKNRIHKAIKNGEVDIVIGTHALITDGIEYHNLGLVIADEQHRFGVNQRGVLKEKGFSPDTLYMSATPIPRTYALTIYGDMDISVIKTMPKGRKEIKTILKKETEMLDVLNIMLEQLKKGHQVYVIAPLIEESEKLDLENVEDIEKKMQKAFGKYFNIGVVHGKMKPQEKDQVMEDFKLNKIQILISTTVVEVGVDNPNATMIVIFDSFRFGLSTLHQLRGRVGRNDLESYCILISNKETKRLSILTETNDGFLISEEDFKLRGSGDLFGVRQSGDMSFSIADIKSDFDILVKAQEDSLDYLNSSEYLSLDFNNPIKKIVVNSLNLD